MAHATVPKYRELNKTLHRDDALVAPAAHARAGGGGRGPAGAGDHPLPAGGGDALRHAPGVPRHQGLARVQLQGRPEHSPRRELSESSEEVLGVEPGAAGGRGGELLRALARRRPAEGHQRGPPARPHTAYRIPQFRRKIQSSNRMDRPRQVRAGGGVRAGVAGAGRAVRGRVLPHVRGRRHAHPPPGALLARPPPAPPRRHPRRHPRRRRRRRHRRRPRPRTRERHMIRSHIITNDR